MKRKVNRPCTHWMDGVGDEFSNVWSYSERTKNALHIFRLYDFHKFGFFLTTLQRIIANVFLENFLHLFSTYGIMKIL